MRNIIVYYVAIFLSVPFLVWVSKSGNASWFVILLLIYAIPYRTLTDGSRLVSKGLIQWSGIWKLLIPGHSRQYTKDLYFRI